MMYREMPPEKTHQISIYRVWGVFPSEMSPREAYTPLGFFPGVIYMWDRWRFIACVYKTVVTSRACVRVRCIVEQNTSTRFAQQWAFAAFWSGESFWTSLRRLPPPILCWARCLEQTTTNTLLRLGAPVVVTIESLSCNRASILHPSSQRFVLRMLRFSTRNQVRLSKDQSKDFTSLFIYFLLCSPHYDMLSLHEFWIFMNEYFDKKR